jgi:hypothetical protein
MGHRAPGSQFRIIYIQINAAGLRINDNDVTILNKGNGPANSRLWPDMTNTDAAHYPRKAAIGYDRNAPACPLP